MKRYDERKKWGPLGMQKPFLVRNDISSDGCNFETARVISSFRSSHNRKLILYYLKKEMGYKLQMIREGTEAWWRFDGLDEVDLFLKRIKGVPMEYLIS